MGRALAGWGGVLLVLSFVCTAGVVATDISATSLADSESEHEFEVTITEAEPTTEGEPIPVTVEVENVGTGAGEEDVILEVPDIGTDTEPDLALQPDETETVELTVETSTEDAEESPYTAAVSAGDDTDTTDVEVQLPVVGNSDAPPQDLTGDGEYEDVRGTGEFTIFDVQVFFNNLDNPTIEDHAWAYDFHEGGQPNLFDVQALFNKLTGDTGPITQFEVTLTEVPDTVDTGDEVVVDYEIENLADEGTQDIEFLVDGQEEGVESGVTLDTDETFSDAFTYETGGEDVPEIDVTVASEDDTDTASVAVVAEAEAEFEVTLTEVPDTVEAGDEVVVGYEVENTGEGTGTQDIEFLVDGEQAETEPGVSLDAGETFGDTFSYTTTDDDVPEIEVGVATDDDTSTALIEVTIDQPEILVSVDDTTETGDTVEIETTFESLTDEELPIQGGDVDLELGEDAPGALNFEGITEDGFDGITSSHFGDDGQFSFNNFEGDTVDTPITVVAEFEISGELQVDMEIGFAQAFDSEVNTYVIDTEAGELDVGPD